MVIESYFQMAKNNVKSQRNTYGWYRVENVGAFSSLVFLGSLSFGTAIEALQVSSVLLLNI